MTTTKHEIKFDFRETHESGAKLVSTQQNDKLLGDTFFFIVHHIRQMYEDLPLALKTFLEEKGYNVGSIFVPLDEDYVNNKNVRSTAIPQRIIIEVEN